MKCQQRQLLFELLQFLIVDIVIGLLIVKYMQKIIKTFMNNMLSLRWTNNYDSLQLKFTSQHRYKAMHINNDDDDAVDDDDDNNDQSLNNKRIPLTTIFICKSMASLLLSFYLKCMKFIRFIHWTCARLLNCRIVKINSTTPIQPSNPSNDIQINQIHQQQKPSHELFRSKRKLCQIKLITFLDSFKQIYKLNDFTVNIFTFLSETIEKFTNYSV